MAQNPYKAAQLDWYAKNPQYEGLLNYPGIGFNPNQSMAGGTQHWTGVMMNQPGFQGNAENPGVMTNQGGYQGPGQIPIPSVSNAAAQGLRNRAWETAQKKLAAAKSVSPMDGVGGVADAASGGGMFSKLGGLAKGMMPGSGTNINQMFGSKALQAGGKLAKIGAMPGWAIPAAAAAAWQINKRLGQKAHQKDLRRFEDQVRGMSTQQQYEMGLQKPTHSRHGGMLGRLFRR